MIYAHIFLDNKMIAQPLMEHCYSLGDTVRISSTKHAKVTEIVWCLDEDSPHGQRVNIRLESETIND